jgi:hypothetical protein
VKWRSQSPIFPGTNAISADEKERGPNRAEGELDPPPTFHLSNNAATKLAALQQSKKSAASATAKSVTALQISSFADDRQSTLPTELAGRHPKLQRVCRGVHQPR